MIQIILLADNVHRFFKLQSMSKFGCFAELIFFYDKRFPVNFTNYTKIFKRKSKKRNNHKKRTMASGIVWCFAYLSCFGLDISYPPVPPTIPQYPSRTCFGLFS